MRGVSTPGANGASAYQIAVANGIGEHDRVKDRRRCKNRLVAAIFQPGEQVFVGRLEPVPERFDLAHLLPAELRKRLLGKAGRYPDP